jgi:hypothetical protein
MAIAAYIPTDYEEKNKSELFWKKLSNFIDRNWYLKNVANVRLDQLVSPYQKTKFSITLSKNSIYSSRLDWKTFNVVWWRDKRTWKYTFVFENWPLKRKRVLIWNWDKLWEYQDTFVKSNNFDKKYEKKDNIKDYKNILEKNRSFIDWLKLPNNYKKIALEFASKLKSNEILTKKTPIALVDSSKREMLYTVKWKKIIVPVLLWKNWITYWWYIPWDRKTLAWKIHRFDPSISKIASSPNWDASNSWKSKTVKSASLQSSLSMATWWRYFHWVDDYRIKWRFKGMWTWWCVWVDKNTIRKMYYAVKRNGGWYGYIW